MLRGFGIIGVPVLAYAQQQIGIASNLPPSLLVHTHNHVMYKHNKLGVGLSSYELRTNLFIFTDYRGQNAVNDCCGAIEWRVEQTTSKCL